MITFTPIRVYYKKDISPHEETLLQDLILHHKKLTTAKQHKNNAQQLLMQTALNLFSSMVSTDHTLRRQLFWKTARQSFWKVWLLRLLLQRAGRASGGSKL
jgi:hypothetical protein